jgi:hypothetical protein
MPGGFLAQLPVCDVSNGISGGFMGSGDASRGIRHGSIGLAEVLTGVYEEMRGVVGGAMGVF